MPKRPASAGILCPGCSANFDTETHVPFMGSCGDSICAVCLNEKKIKNCPECNLEGGFTCSQKNKLALKLLSDAAEKEATDSKKAKLDVGEEMDAPEEPVPAILATNNRHFLAQIINQLNPRSFVNLASTCKTLHNYCFNCKDVNITYDISSINVKMDHFGFEFDIDEPYFGMIVAADDSYSPSFLSLDYAGYKHGLLSSVVGRKKLRNYPFVFKLRKLVFHEVNRFDDAFFTPLRTLFAELSIKTVTSFGTSTDTHFDWVFPAVSNGFLQFFKDFRILEVYFYDTHFAEDIYDEALNYLLQNSTSFSAPSMDIPERMLLNASVPDLNLSTSVSIKTFVDLIKKFADSTDEINWKFRCDFELHDALRSLMFCHSITKALFLTNAPSSSSRTTKLTNFGF